MQYYYIQTLHYNNISLRICTNMLIFGKEACFILFFFCTLMNINSYYLELS